MSEWIHSSLHPLAPFHVSNYNYTKLAVDRTQAADQSMYNILLLATGMSRQYGNLPSPSVHLYLVLG